MLNLGPNTYLVRAHGAWEQSLKFFKAPELKATFKNKGICKAKIIFSLQYISITHVCFKSPCESQADVHQTIQEYFIAINDEN